MLLLQAEEPFGALVTQERAGLHTYLGSITSWVILFQVPPPTARPPRPQAYLLPACSADLGGF